MLLQVCDRPVNAFFRWRNVSDTADAVEPKLFLVRAADLKTSFAVPAEATADVSLRRVQKLKVAPGVTAYWTFGTAKSEARAGPQGRHHSWVQDHDGADAECPNREVAFRRDDGRPGATADRV